MNRLSDFLFVAARIAAQRYAGLTRHTHVSSHSRSASSCSILPCAVCKSCAMPPWLCSQMANICIQGWQGRGFLPALSRHASARAGGTGCTRAQAVARLRCGCGCGWRGRRAGRAHAMSVHESLTASNPYLLSSSGGDSAADIMQGVDATCCGHREPLCCTNSITRLKHVNPRARLFPRRALLAYAGNTINRSSASIVTVHNQFVLEQRSQALPRTKPYRSTWPH
jgi:hypothetical protein